MQNDEGRYGERTDGRNLIEEWLEERNKEGKAIYVSHKQQLDEVDVDKTDFLLGLFEHDHCMYRLDILNNKLENQEPLLTQMTETALKMLQKEENGFFLLVEGGRIDHAHHSNYARKSLDETAEFARAIELSRLMTSDDDTLIVVTSDHSHVFTYNGYAYRQDDVLKTTGYGARDGLHFEILSYANGPGYNRTYGECGNRSDIINDDFTHVSRRYSAMVPLSSETHGGEDIGVYSLGPWSHLFQGSYEQSDIPLVMAYAAKIGPYVDRDQVETTTECTGSDCGSANSVLFTFTLLILSLVIVFYT
jgi:alkaline phosphatase